MSDVALRTYYAHIDQFIEQKQLDEAVAHCKHVLTHYPKNLETYRLLGKALLEKGRHGDAADIFQRVLSAAPDDFVAHVGMSIVREDEANLEAALWHMERAFESNPANNAIQDELRRLYGRRDGVVPPRARLTRGALARMYLKGELFPQAEAELRTALHEDPERLDLSTLLARVLWETHRRPEAADVCNSILQKLPYSQEANRILAQIMLSQNREEEATAYRQRIEALDPYEAYANGHGSAAVSDDSVRLPALEADAAELSAEAAQTPEWATSLGESFEPSLADQNASLTEEPDWLRTGTGILTGGTAALTSTPDLPAAGEVPDWLKDVQPIETETSASTHELPDWMRATTGMPTEAPTEASPPKKGTGGLTGWLKPESATTPSPDAPAPGEVPDWLKAATEEARASTESAAPTDDSLDWLKTTELGAAAGGTAAFTDDLPDWMKASPELSSAETMPLDTETGGPSPEATPADDVPEWLKPVLPAAEPPAWMQTGKLESEPTEPLPEWLRASTTPEPLPSFDTGTLSPEAAEPVGGLPEWLRPASPEQQASEAEGLVLSEAEGPASEAPAPTDVPSFASTATPSAETPSAHTSPFDLGAEAQADEDLPDWLKATTSSAVSDLPPWMQTGKLEPDVAEPADDVPEWLKPALRESEGPVLSEAQGAVGRVEEPAAQAPTAQPASPAVELPDFLQLASAEAIERANQPMELDEEEAEPPTAEEAGIPDWLKAMAPDQSAEPAAAHLADDLPPVAAEELPDWLQASAPQPMATDEGADLSADDAMAWLESLAAKQGAAPEELVTKPEDRTETPPDWLAAAAPTEPASGMDETLEPEPVADIPDWLRSAMGQMEEPGAAPSISAGEEPLQETPTSPTPVAADVSAMDMDADLSADDAMAWLESLAAKQGAAPEELITKAEERTETPPDWVRAAHEPAPEAEPPAPADSAVAPSAPAEEAPIAPVDFPPWAQPTEPGPSDTVANWLADKKVPEWLRKPGEPTGAPSADWLRAPLASNEEEPPIGEPALPDWLQETAAERPSAPAEPKADEMSADDAMAWLESLAAKQGAAPEELITKPEERTDTPPDWLVQEHGPIMPPTGILPPTAILPEQSALPSEEPEMAAPSAEPPAPTAEGEMSFDDAMAWLESLAAKQGAAPEELITKPEDRTETPPSWLSPEQGPDEVGPHEVGPHEVGPHEVGPHEVGPHEVGPIMPPTGLLPSLEESPATGASFVAQPGEEEPVPDLSAMSADDAMAWLESLAAKQGAAPEELITKPEDRTETPPDWVSAALEPAPEGEPPAPAASAETEAEPTGERTTVIPDWLSHFRPDEESMEPPDWVKTHVAAEILEAASPPESTPEAHPEPEAITPAESEQASTLAGEAGEMEVDDAMAWLEGLAAKQGAAPEELITKPEERTEVAPDWIAAQAPDEDADASLPAELSAMNAEDAMAWLEGLAAKQGAAPEELITKPEERTETPPEWMAEETAEAQASEAESYGTQPLSLEAEPLAEPAAGLPDWIRAMAEGAPAEPEVPTEMKAASPTDELPDWIAAAAATQTPEVSAPPMEEAPAQAEIIDQPPAAPTAPAPEKAATGKESSDERLARLAEKLTSTRRAKDADIAARFERQRAERESAQRDIEQRMEERRTSLLAPTPSTGSLRKPGTGFLGQKKKTESLAADQAKTEEKGKTQPLPKTSGLKPAAEPAAPAKATRSLARSKKTRRRKAASYNPADVLFASRQQLSNSEFDQALDGFQQLITDGQLLDEVIVELETFTDWNPGQRSFYTALGDAYMRHNQLQKAIDTYRLALNQY